MGTSAVLASFLGEQCDRLGTLAGKRVQHNGGLGKPCPKLKPEMQSPRGRWRLTLWP